MLGCARWYKRHEVSEGAPKGGVGMIEALVVMINDEVIKGCIGEDYRRYAPYLLTAFFFVLVNNLMGILPIFPGGAKHCHYIGIGIVHLSLHQHLRNKSLLEGYLLAESPLMVESSRASHAYD